MSGNKSALSVVVAGGGTAGHIEPALAVADAVKAAGLGDIDKRSIELSAPVKSLGRHDATVRLRSDVLAALTLDVVAAK